MSGRRNRSTVATMFGLPMWLAVGSANAQATTGSILGRMLDPSGGVLPGVRITIVSERTGTTRETVTDAEGAFVVSTLTPDIYTITMALENFKTSRSIRTTGWTPTL
jgi:hypothetical protein